MEKQLEHLGGYWAPKAEIGYQPFDGICIMSDGSGYNTKILDGKTGKAIPGIRALKVTCDAAGSMEAVLYDSRVKANIKSMKVSHG